jgi:ABC-type multidrug transport system fused ATPase/permease subunit
MNKVFPSRSLVWTSCSKSIALLSRGEKWKYFRITFLQFSSAILDLIALFMIGIVSLSLGSRNSIDQSSGFLGSSLLRFNEIFENNEIFVLFAGLAIIFLLVAKSIISLFTTRKLILFLARVSAKKSDKIYSNFMKQDVTFIQRFSSQGVVSALNQGVSNAILGILSSLSLLVSELGLLLIITVGLCFVDPIGTLVAITYFALIFWILQKTLSDLNRNAGRKRIDLEIKATTLIQESIQSFRELVVLGRLPFALKGLSEVRSRSVQAFADAQWVSLVPKYFMETALVLGAGMLGLYQFVLSDSANVLSSVAIFFAAGSRVLPSVLRIQSAVGSMTNYAGASEFTFEFIEQIPQSDSQATEIDIKINAEEKLIKSFIPKISLSSVDYKYSSDSNFALKNISLEIPAGSSLALVGPTGSGKSTLVDLIVGMIPPDNGTILIDRYQPKEMMQIWPNQIGYVPQQVFLSNSTLRENVAFACSIDEIDDEKVWIALEKTQLKSFFQNSKLGLDTPIGEHGVKLSGGQRQRVGLARSLYANPKILILDEATSALDSETEAAISKAIESLKEDVTLVFIAHRLATIRNVDTVVYLQHGEILAMGTFEHVRSSVPKFDLQSSLMGLA